MLITSVELAHAETPTQVPIADTAPLLVFSLEKISWGQTSDSDVYNGDVSFPKGQQMCTNGIDRE